MANIINYINLKGKDINYMAQEKIVGTVALTEFWAKTVEKIDNILPIVTSADNGKVARVVGGQWSAVSLPYAEDEKF